LAIVIIICIVSGYITPVIGFGASKKATAHVEKGRKLSSSLESLTNSSASKRVIIQTKGTPSTSQDEAIQAKGGSRRASFDNLNMLVADVPGKSLAELAAREDVVYISADQPVQAHGALVTESTGADQVQAGAPGAPALDG